MPFQLSPGVLVKEIDLTNVVPAVATSIGAMAGAFHGPYQLSLERMCVCVKCVKNRSGMRW